MSHQAMSDQEIIAQCGCGQLRVTLKGVADERHLCCCTDCQKRSGSAFGSSWYYEPEDVLSVSGAYATFPRTGTRGTQYAFHYCPSCGSTVFWHVDGNEAVGVAGGCVAAEHQAGPQDVVWVRSKPDWYEPPRNVPWYDQGTASEMVWKPE